MVFRAWLYEKTLDFALAKVLDVMGKALLSKLSRMGTGLVADVFQSKYLRTVVIS